MAFATFISTLYVPMHWIGDRLTPWSFAAGSDRFSRDIPKVFMNPRPHAVISAPVSAIALTSPRATPCLSLIWTLMIGGPLMSVFNPAISIEPDVFEFFAAPFVWKHFLAKCPFRLQFPHVFSFALHGLAAVWGKASPQFQCEKFESPSSFHFAQDRF